MNDYFDNWTIQLRKGLLEIGILSALKGRERYGYDLVKSLVEVPGLGVTEGTVYPLLSRLRKHGWIDARLVESSEGPSRKYYTLTSEGQHVMETMESHLNVLLKGVRTLKEQDA